jgi:hypothetical protein
MISFEKSKDLATLGLSFCRPMASTDELWLSSFCGGAFGWAQAPPGQLLAFMVPAWLLQAFQCQTSLLEKVLCSYSLNPVTLLLKQTF